MLETVLVAIGGVACALLLGGMVSFAGFFARHVFAKLPQDTAATFMRAVFPSYYMLMAGFAAVAAAGIALRHPWGALVLALVALGFLIARHWLMPQAQALHEARERGQPGAQESFAQVHQRSAMLNLIQMAATLVVLVRLLVDGR